MCNAAIITFYSNRGADYAKVEALVNGRLPPGTYRFALAEDGMMILFFRGVSKVCFDTKQFRGVMGSKFFESSSHIMAFDNAVRPCTTTR